MLSTDSILSLLDADGIGNTASAGPMYFVSSPPPPPPQELAGGGSALAVAPFPLEQTFFLNSLPGASKTIYLDFDGHLTRETQWNTDFALPNIASPAYNLDGDFGGFSSIEQLVIQNVWERVSEDFRPFNVNVTTQDPGVEALRKFEVDSLQLPPVASTDVGQVIDDVVAVNSTLNFSGPVTSITDVNVTLNISHTWDSDLNVLLISPEGTAIELFAGVGGDGNNFLNTVLDDQATIAITDPAATPPFAGSFQPEEALSGLNGENPNGIWTLVVQDDVPGDNGVLNGWSLTITGGAIGDTEWGQRVVIGGDSTYDWFTPNDPEGRVVGGVAYGSFTWDTDTPAFVFGGGYGASALGIAETISHETGHTLGLSHDGQFRFYRDISEDPPEYVRVYTEYYTGHGSGPTSWGPIMGTSAGQGLTQWSNGEYFNATNSDDDDPPPPQDDLAVITGNNGFGYRVDDHGNDEASASPLATDSRLFSAEGIVEQNTDVDWFEFTVEGIGEAVTFDLDPFQQGPNLDILARLYNSSGTEIAVSNPEFGIDAGTQTYTGAGDGGWLMNHLDVDPANDKYIDHFVLAPGMYYLSVEGAGRPVAFVDPAVHPGPVDLMGPPSDENPFPPDTSDWGYSNYGSLGYYNIEGTRKPLVIGVDFDESGGASPSNWTLFSGGGPLNVLNNLISEAGAVTPFDLTISTTGASIDAFASENPINTGHLPDHSQPLDTLDGYLGGGGDTWTFTWSDLEPLNVYQIWVFGHADLEARNLVTIVGGEWNGAVQTTNFTQDIAADSLIVNDNPPGNQELRTLSYLAISEEILDAEGNPTGEGRITITVTNELGYAAALGGLAIAPTKVGSIEGQKWNDLNGNGVINLGEEGLEGWTIYLDLNNNGMLDRTSTEDQQVVASAPNVPQEILNPDPVLGFRTVKNEVVVEELGDIVDVNVTLDITHTFDADLNVYLISPSGTRVKLFSDIGGPGDNFTNTTLDDEALTPITSGTAPFTGTFRPEPVIDPLELSQFPSTFTTLSAFDGEDANGTWTLEITDDAAGDVGVLNSWSLTITVAGIDIFLEPVTVTDANGNYFFADLPAGLYHVREHFQEDQVLAGWDPTPSQSDGIPPVTVSSGAEVRFVNFGNWIPVAVPGSIGGQKWNDLDGDGEKDAEEPGLGGWTIYVDSNNNGVRDIASAPTTVAAEDLPKPIIDFAPTTSQIAFDEVGTVLTVEVTLDITHSFMGDLDAFLISPSGRRVELFTDVGGQFNDFDDVTLADDAEFSIAEIEDHGLPYTGRWQPEGSLEGFLGDDAFGTWTLEIRDVAFADEGMLNSWSLTITVGELVATTSSDPGNEGNYVFNNLPANQYIIREEQQPGWSQTFPALPDQRWVVDLGFGENITGRDFGNQAQVLLAGDYNQDGSVDAADYILWRKTLTTVVNPPYSGADGNGSGAVDQNDYGVWTANFGNSLPGGGGGSGAEAEPAALSVELEASSSPLIAAPAAASVVTVAQDASEKSSLADEGFGDSIIVDSPTIIHASSQDRFSSTAPGSVDSDDLSDAALVAWLVSLAEGPQPDDHDDSSDADSAEWRDESFDSLDSLDSIFELLGAAVA